MKKVVLMAIILTSNVFASQECEEFAQAQWASSKVVEWCVSKDFKSVTTIKRFEICVSEPAEICDEVDVVKFTDDISCLSRNPGDHKIVGMCEE